MPSQGKTLTVEIDRNLAAQYRADYVRAFGTIEDDRTSLARFMAAFVEDRLDEEIEFLEREESDDRK